MPSSTLSIGQARGLQACSTPNGAIAIMALDHRNNLRNALNPAAPSSVSDADMTEFKKQVVSALADVSSAVLLDPEVGAAQCVASGCLPGSTGLLVAVEATGYTGDPTARASQVLPGWSVKKARRMGASAVKLLVYYHPDTAAAGDIEALVEQVGAECTAADLPLFLEPLSYSADPAVKKLPPAERRRVVIETARRLTAIQGVTILKAEFPLDIAAQPDQQVWAEACAELTAASAVPWVLLSASVSYETYLRQVTVACQQGASGVAVGRAVWQEAPGLQGQERHFFLNHVARPRMQRITHLCDALARPYTQHYPLHQPSSDWYKGYSE